MFLWRNEKEISVLFVEKNIRPDEKQRLQSHYAHMQTDLGLHCSQIHLVLIFVVRNTVIG